MKGTTLIFGGSGGGKKRGYEGVASLSKAQLERDTTYQKRMGILPNIHEQLERDRKEREEESD
jgi:hypothetical protein